MRKDNPHKKRGCEEIEDLCNVGRNVKQQISMEKKHEYSLKSNPEDRSVI